MIRDLRRLVKMESRRRVGDEVGVWVSGSGPKLGDGGGG
jgi:hypothetical protein